MGTTIAIDYGLTILMPDSFKTTTGRDERGNLGHPDS